MPRLTVLVPLANDAEKDLSAMVCTDIGSNMKQRIDDAVVWHERSRKSKPSVWCFGAGTDEAFRRGPTLSTLAKKYLHTTHFFDNVIVNESRHNFYGTFEEIKWIVKSMEANSLPADTQFVFFAPNWHLWRVRFIWFLFYQWKWGKANFVATNDGATFELWHECKAWVKVLLVWMRLVKSRDQISYPPVKHRYGIEN
ncbi:MAG: hypothetical protein RLZZ70_767 [Candidatus Parcubacteria bacterium]|jgi:hypothetical protein